MTNGTSSSPANTACRSSHVIQTPRTGSSENPLAEAYTGEGVLVNSGPFDGMDNREAIRAIADHWPKNGGKVDRRSPTGCATG